jgi:hypothetical protein
MQTSVKPVKPKGDFSVQAYAQWVNMYYDNKSKIPLVVKNVSLSWGKFYKGGKLPVYPSVLYMFPSRWTYPDPQLECL